MKKSNRVVIVHEGPDWEKEAAKKKLSEQEIKDMVPEYWKDRARAAQTSKLLLPIKGSQHYA